jgi:hypothetical protein
LFNRIFPESPRWLATTGNEEKAIKALRIVARRNGRQEPKDSDLISILRSCHHRHGHQQHDKSFHSLSFSQKLKGIALNFKSLLDTREAFKLTLTIWALFNIVAFVYYGFAFSTNLTSDPYLLVALG